MAVTKPERRVVPPHVRKLKLGERYRWARKSAGLSHDKLVAAIGRSNRSHMIKIERGDHTPGPDLRDAIADACGVPGDLFVDDDAEARALPLTPEELVMLGALMARLGPTISPALNEASR